MSTVKFLFGSKTALPTSAPTNALLFTDTGELFKGTGTGLLSFGSVLYGYADLDDLQAKNPSIEGKLFLTAENKLYSFSNGTYNLVSGASTVESFDSTKVTYDNATSTLVGENVQSAITELDGKVETNKAEITTVKGRVDVLETDNTQNKADVAELQANEGKVKLDANDTSAYLGEKLDNVTVQVVDGKIKVVGLDGVTVGATELNQLTGITGNVQTQLNDLLASISASASGMTFGNTINTKAELDALTNVINGTLYVVLADETNGEGRTMYIYSEDASAFVFVGQFEFSMNFLGMLDTPNSYEEGKILKSTDSGIVFSDQDYNDLINKPQSTITDIDSAVTLKHEHVNLNSVNKIGEDADGKLLFDGKPVSNEIVWEEFNI